MKITENKFVSVEYDLFVDGEAEGDERELMEQATEFRPMNFIFGMKMMLPKFEEALAGMEEGDTFEFAIANEDAYGPYDDDNVVPLPRSIFENKKGRLDENEVFSSSLVPLMDHEGVIHQAQVAEVTDTEVIIDFNHPFAGENLYFKGKILEVRDPTNEELATFINESSSCSYEEEEYFYSHKKYLNDDDDDDDY